MKRQRIAAVAVSIIVLAALELPADEAIQTIPIGNYETFSTGTRTIHSPGAGLLLLKGESMFVGRYGYQTLDSERAPGDPRRFHAIEALYDSTRGRHRFLSVFKANSDAPVAGGWHTFQAASVYGYQVVETAQTSITVGGGLAVGDFGIETGDGGTWPLLPVPYVQATFTSPLLALSFDFITGPNLNVTVAPENDLRFIADARLDQFRDLQDLIFEIALAYRILSAGIANQGFTLNLAEEKTTVDVGSYVLFGRVDLTILTVTGGYAVEGWQRRGDDLDTGMGEGLFLSVQALLPLGGGDR